MKYAIVQIGDFKIPLLGIAPEEVLETCDCCHDIFSIHEIELAGRQFLCAKCRSGDTRSIYADTLRKRI